MARRTREEAQKTRERILDAAVEVFHARGVATPSLSDVAKLAEVTRGAIYGHFKNKSDVFSALCDRISLPLEAACWEADSDGGDNPLAGLQRGWVNFFQHTATDEQQRRILTIIIHRCELLKGNGLILQRLEDGRERGLANMTSVLEHAVGRGQLPSELNIDLALRFFHSSVTGLLSEWLFDPDAFDLAKVSVQVVEGLVDTLRYSPALRSFIQQRECLNLVE